MPYACVEFHAASKASRHLSLYGQDFAREIGGIVKARPLCRLKFGELGLISHAEQGAKGRVMEGLHALRRLALTFSSFFSA